MKTMVYGKTMDELRAILERDEVLEPLRDTPSMRLVLLQARREEAIQSIQQVKTEMEQIDMDITQLRTQIALLNNMSYDTVKGG